MSRATAIRTATIAAGAVDASATPVFYWRAPCQCVIDGIYLINSAAVAAHATDIATIAVTNLGTAGAGSDVVATRTTDSDVSGSAAIAANIAWEITKSTTAANLEVAAGEVLKIAPTEGGTATSGDLADATFQIDYLVGTGIGYS